MAKLGILSALLLLVAILLSPCEAAEGGIIEPNASAMHSDFASHLISQDSQQRTRDALATARQQWNLPTGHLEEAVYYTPNQYDYLNNHLHDPGTRFYPVFKGQGFRLYASPIFVPRPNTVDRQNAVAFLKVHDDGSIVSMGYSGYSSKRIDSYGMTLYDMVAHRAKMTWQQLVHHHKKPLQLVHM